MISEETGSIDSMLESIEGCSYDFLSGDLSNCDSFFDRNDSENRDLNMSQERDNSGNLHNNLIADPSKFYVNLPQKDQGKIARSKTNKQEKLKTKSKTKILSEITNKHSPPQNQIVTRSKKIAGDRFLSMAEQVMNFQKETPERFHLPSKKDEWKPKILANPLDSCHLTVPVTPKLVSHTRVRNVKVESQKEKEERELEELKKNQFKAHPCNPEIFKEQPTRVCLKRTTKPVPFNLHTNLTKQKLVEENKFEFHARPVPETVYKKPVEPRPSPKITIPETPSFVRRMATKRQADDSCLNDKDLSAAIFKKEVKPFSFVERDLQRLKEREEFIQRKVQEEEELLRKGTLFQAKPLPDLTKPDFVPKHDLKITDPKPFKFKADPPAKKRKLDLEEIPNHFKARPIPPGVLEAPKFILSHTENVTECENIVLHTEMRAKDREQYELERLARHELLMAEKAKKEQERLLAEEAEVEALRKATVHKANPVRHYAPVTIQKSMIPLTIPESPKFSNKLSTK